MDTFQSWTEIMAVSFGNMWLKIGSYLPKLMGATLILVLGLFAAAILGRVAKKLFAYTKIDKLNEKMGIKDDLEGLGLRFRFADLVGVVVRWFFIVLTLITIVDILNIPQLTSFLHDLALYMPNVIIALIILAIGLVAGTFIHNLTERGLRAASMPDTTTRIMSGLIKWSVFSFALMAGLVQLGVASSLIQILFAGVVIMFSLAGGIAFGLGGRDQATRIIGKIEREINAAKNNHDDRAAG